MSLSTEERQLRARAGGHTRAARDDMAEVGARGAAANRARFEAEADPDQTLDPAERRRRGEQLFKAHLAQLSLKAARMRRRPDTSADELEALASELIAVAQERRR